MKHIKLTCLAVTIFWTSCTAATAQESAPAGPVLFIQGHIFPSTFTFGATVQKHRLGIFTSKSNGNVYYSLGTEYAYHFSGALKTGVYIKAFFERRWFAPGLEINERYDEESRTWKHDTVDNHTANHVGAIFGVQWHLGMPQLFMQAGIGWQHNSNPINARRPKFYIGLGDSHDVRARTEVAGEVGIGYFFF